MLRFFRHIRQKLFLEGKVSKYLGYALGEIVLIVVGILIALQISDANEARKNRLEEQEILHGLQREYSRYFGQLEGSLESYQSKMSAMSDILRAIEFGGWLSKERTIDEAIGRLLIPPSWDSGGGVRDALVQGGRLELISNRDLREKLSNWPRFYEEVRDDQHIGRDFVMQDIIPYFNSNGIDLGGPLTDWTEWPVEYEPWASDKQIVKQILSDPKFKSLVQVRYAFWWHLGGEYENARDAAQEILDLIHSELSN